jgi:beta-lactamase class A
LNSIPAVCLVLVAQAAPDPGSRVLEERLKPLIEAHRGQVGLMVKHLDSGACYSHRAEVPMPTASLIKFPVMIEAYRQEAEGSLDLDQPVTLGQEDKVPGSGILTDHLSPGVTFPLRDAVRLMIAFSDNTATNLVLEAIGIKSTAEAMEKLGCPETKIHSKVYRRDTSVFPDRSERFGLGSTTAAEMIRLFELLHRDELVSPAASKAMRDHLLKCSDQDTFPRFLPEGTKIAFKTGAVEKSRTAAGILETPGGPVAICVLTTANQDTRFVPDNAAERLCAEVAYAVYHAFPTKPENPGATNRP